MRAAAPLALPLDIPTEVFPSATPTPSPAAAPRPSPTAQPATGPAPAPVHRGDLRVYAGVGTWVDAYDFSREYGGKTPYTAVDEMARAGVRTIYLQAAKEGPKSPHPLLSQDRLALWLTRAHARGIRVVAWYLPLFENPARDRAHFEAILRFRASGQSFDAVGMDIEWRGEKNVRVRNERLVALTQWLRKRAPQMPLAGIVLPPVVTDVIAPKYWTPFPWDYLRNHYDVWMTMGYWTNRKADSGWRDPYRYTTENVRLLRDHLRRPSAPVHVVGGIGYGNGAQDLALFRRAAADTGSIGLSLYDWATASPAAHRALG